MAYNTNNPLGSNDFRDLSDNAVNFDKFSVGSDPAYLNRFGALKLSIEGMNQEFNNAQDGRTAAFQQFLADAAFVFIGDYTGGLTFSNRSQYTIRDGVPYRLAPSATLPYTTTGNWALEVANFTPINSDDILRQDLAASGGSALVMDGSMTVAARLAAIYPFRNITPEQFGDTGDGVTTTANDAINAALVFAKTNGGFVNLTPGKTYLIDGNANPINTTITGNRNGGVLLQSGVRLNLNNAILKSTVSTQNGYSILNYTNTDGAEVYGPGRIWGDVVDHSSSTAGEYGYGAFFTQCQNAKLIGITIDRCWGDGMFFGEGTPGDATTAPANCHVTEVVCDYNRRQGVSFVGSFDITLTDCVFKRTGRIRGTAPSAGFDLETDNSPGQVNRRIKFINCRSYDNVGTGGGCSGLANSAQDIVLINCEMSDNINGALRTEFNACQGMKIFGGRLDGGITGGQNMELYGVDVEMTTGALSEYAIHLDLDAGFKMFGGSVTSNGSKNLYFSPGTTTDDRKNMMIGVDFFYVNGATGAALNPNGINVWQKCGFYVGGTTPSGNFGFDVLKFDGTTAQIDDCYFDPAYHSGSPGLQFKGRFSTARTRGGSNAAPSTGTGVVGQFVQNVAPTVAGAAGSQYIILGWMCTVAGTPGTWVATRCATGT